MTTATVKSSNLSKSGYVLTWTNSQGIECEAEIEKRNYPKDQKYGYIYHLPTNPTRREWISAANMRDGLVLEEKPFNPEKSVMPNSKVSSTNKDDELTRLANALEGEARETFIKQVMLAKCKLAIQDIDKQIAELELKKAEYLKQYAQATGTATEEATEESKPE